MIFVDYLIQKLIENGVTDVFGIPGGVGLDLRDCINRTNGITPHLSYHEQAAAFEACGYAQVNHTFGVAYATRGPGFTNLITGIADAYADSIPVLFLTGHSGTAVKHSMRFEKDQEMDTVSMVKYITKYAATIESESEIWKINEAINQALSGRKGPVFLDVSAGLWQKTVEVINDDREKFEKKTELDISDFTQYMKPILLVGDGVRQSNSLKEVIRFAEQHNLPVISSRCSEDVGSNCKNYYGYVGSHGMRTANFIFDKADLVIALGNRMAFSPNSKSFASSLVNKKIIRVDIDKTELQREFPNTKQYNCDIKEFISNCDNMQFFCDEKWIKYCDKLKLALHGVDTCETVEFVKDMFKKIPNDSVVVADVGNNEFWVALAYVLSGVKNRILYSKAFGALGNAIAKSIGVYYATLKPVVCIIGDQGFQLNIQELQMIAHEQLPITICVLNNRASGMIRDRQIVKYNGVCCGTTPETGYDCPSIKKIAVAYEIEYKTQFEILNKPLIVELIINEDVTLKPNLPIGNSCKEMAPLIPMEVFHSLDKGI